MTDHRLRSGRAGRYATKTARQSWQLDRRECIGLGLGATAAAALWLHAAPAHSKVPVKIGGFSVETLSDGHLQLPANMVAPDVDAAAREAALSAAGQSGDTIKSPLNVTLVRHGEDLILVDVGSGSRFMATAGKLATALEARGIAADAITKVIYTHAHPDHLWGTIDDFDEVAFPNAAFYIAAEEWNFWMSDDVMTKLAKERQGFAVGAKRNLSAIKDRIKTLKPGDDLVTGMRLIETGGHTPGHVSIEITAGNDSLMILGDALSHPVISFEHPEWQPAVDQDKDRAVATRKKLLARLAADKTRIIGYHLPDPGFGMVRAKGTGFAFERMA